ncbi:glycoside hydrolase family 19 protein, partial [Vibrio lentus]
ISPKNAEENPLVVLDGSDSSGAVDMSNSFIQQLLESVTEDQVTDFSSFTARDAKVYLDGKRKHFERFIVKHPTDWHTESSQSLYESIHQTAKEALDIKCSAGFVTEEDYRNSPWRDQVMDSFDLFSQFELERADKFSWMQDLQGDLQLSGDKTLWHYWPFAVKTEELITFEMVFAANLKRDRSQCLAVTPLLNKYAKINGMHDKKVIAHFLSQVGHESNFKATTEKFSYSAKRMRQIFGCKRGSRYYDKTNDDCKLGRLDNRLKLWTNESDYARNPIALANYVYANRMGNKGEASGDGYKFRGRGLIQITGRDKYEGMTVFHNMNNPDDERDFSEQPDLISESLEYSVSSAFYYWYGFKNLDDRRVKGYSVAQVTQLVNGGENGLDDRLKRFEAICAEIGI